MQTKSALSFGAWFDQNRGKKTLDEISAETGVNKVTLSKIINDKTGVSREMVEKLAGAIGADKEEAMIAAFVPTLLNRPDMRLKQAIGKVPARRLPQFLDAVESMADAFAVN